MYDQTYSSDTVLHSGQDLTIRGTDHNSIINGENQQLIQPTIYPTQNSISVMGDSSVMLTNGPTKQPMIQTTSSIPMDQSQSVSYVPAPFLSESTADTTTVPIINQMQIQNHTSAYESSKRIKINNGIDMDKRVSKKTYLQLGINRFYSCTSLAQHSSTPPTLEEMKVDPKKYYPFLVEILQCFGSNYFDKQGTEKGRGGEITIYQKLEGITQRISNNEKQWEEDERNPDYTSLRLAWRRNIRSHWDAVCSHFQNKQFFIDLIMKDHMQPPLFEESIVPSVHVDNAIVVPVDFSAQRSIDEVFITYPNKTNSSLGDIDENAVTLDPFLNAEQSNRHIKADEETPLSTDVSNKTKKSKKKYFDSFPFPADFRHYKFLPVIKYVLNLNGLTGNLRKKSVIDHLKSIGTYELSKPIYSIRREGGLLTLSDFQLILPPQYGILESITTNTPILLVNMRSNENHKNVLDHETIPKSTMPTSIINQSISISNEIPTIEVISLVHPSSCNTAAISSSVEYCNAVLIHNQKSTDSTELNFESSLKNLIENQYHLGQVHILGIGPYCTQLRNKELSSDVSAMMPIVSSFLQHSYISSSLIDTISSTSFSYLQQHYPDRPCSNETVRSFISQLYTNISKSNSIINKVFKQRGHITTGACKIVMLNNETCMFSGICNCYIIMNYMPVWSVLCTTNGCMDRTTMTEYFSYIIQTTFLTLFPIHSSPILSAYDSFTLLSSNPSLNLTHDVLPANKQRFYSSLFTLCTELAYKMIKTILCVKKCIIISVQGTITFKACQIIVFQLCSNLLFRMQLGEKVPVFPFPIVRSILIENSIKLTEVTININNRCIYANGSITRECPIICTEELNKNDIKIQIVIGNGRNCCDGLTTEWNDRIMKRFEVFCENKTKVETIITPDKLSMDAFSL